MIFHNDAELIAYMSADEGYRSPVVLRSPDATVWTAFEDDESAELYIQTIRVQPVGRGTAIEIGTAAAVVEGYYLTAPAGMPEHAWPMVAIALPANAYDEWYRPVATLDPSTAHGRAELKRLSRGTEGQDRRDRERLPRRTSEPGSTPVTSSWETSSSRAAAPAARRPRFLPPWSLS